MKSGIYNSRYIISSIGALLLLVFVVACDSPPPKPSLLSLVPADTPFVFSNSKPLPKGLMQKILRYLETDLGRTRTQFAGLTPEQQALPMIRFSTLLLDELDGRLSADGLAELGLKMDALSVVYGLGLLPVMHVEISDVARLNAMISRIEERFGQPIPTESLNSIQFRRFDMGQLVGVLAIREKPIRIMTLALLPTTNLQQYLPLVLGLEQPEKSIASESVLQDLIKDQAYTGHGEGYLDLVRVSELLLGKGAGLHASVWRDMKIPVRQPSQACVDLVEKTVPRVPRYLAGTHRASDNEYAITALLETDQIIAKTMQGIAAPVPGLGLPSAAAFSMGMGVHIPALRNAVSAVISYLIEEGRQCEWVDVQRLRRTLPKLTLALGPFSAAIKGFNLELYDLIFKQGSSDLEKMDLRLLLAVDDPRGVYSMLGMLEPKLLALDIPEDGTPVRMPVEKVHSSAPASFVAIKGKALAFGIGDSGRDALPGLLDARTKEPAPMLVFQYDAARLFESIYGLQQLAARTLPEATHADKLEQLEMDLDAMENYGKTFGPATIELYGTNQGLQWEQSILLK